VERVNNRKVLLSLHRDKMIFKNNLGRQGVKPLELCHCNIGAKMHISSITRTNLFIKSPLIEIRRAKKKVAMGINPSQPKFTAPLFQLSCSRRVNYNKKK